MDTVNLITSLVENNQILAYIVIYLGLIFEGEIVVISVGILSHLGALNFWSSLLFIVLGAFSKTFIFYWFGGVLFEKFNHNKVFSYIRKRVYNVFPRFKTKPFWSIFISKFIMGVNYLVVIFSGFEKIEYRKFLKAEISSTLVWAPTLLSLGYFFGYTALHVSREISKFTMVVILLIILFFLFDKLVTWLYEVFEEYYSSDTQQK